MTLISIGGYETLFEGDTHSHVYKEYEVEFMGMLFTLDIDITERCLRYDHGNYDTEPSMEWSLEIDNIDILEVWDIESEEYVKYTDSFIRQLENNILPQHIQVEC